MGGLSPTHWLIVLAVVLLLFGTRKLPDMARGLGQSMRILKAESKAMREDGSEEASSESGSEPHRSGAAPHQVGHADSEAAHRSPQQARSTESDPASSGGSPRS